MMTEIPAAILCFEQFAECGIDTAIIGLNDLTAFTLGSLRNSPFYNNGHPSVVKMMEMLVTKAKAAGVHTIVAGRHTPATIENAMRLGFDAVTIFVPDLLNALRV